jgi:hypothetical protein
MDDITKRKRLKLFITQFLLPQPLEIPVYFFVSLLLLLIASNQTLLVILSDGSPVTDIPLTDVFGQRLDYLGELLQVPILGRIVLFLFWLAIGSVVYMLVWLFQNLAVEVYDDLAFAKLKKPIEHNDEEGGWWGTTLAHAIFIGSAVIVLLFYLLIAVNLLFPAWIQLFQIGLQSISQLNSIVKLMVAVLGTMVSLYILALFWRLFFRLRSYLYNSF